ncbi:polymerase/histidinol phosphatase-like [Phytophthora cactorum]|nr:polymerase/histidinol phosphatase-like [Phytophthora cactorum]
MVSASSGRRKKKKVKKSSKRKPVNLQSNFNRKCSLATTRSVAPDAAYEALSDAMFPSNDDHHSSAHAESHDSSEAGDAACGDFHLHSVCSDGKFKPSEVIAKAAANGVTFMSLTDHDTMAGVSEAIAAAQKLGVLVFPGVEISAEVKGGENLHILGYFYPGSNSAELEKQLLKIRTGRHKRGKGMLKKLEAMGIKLKWERVLEIAGEAAPGRPHVAEALVEAGHVANFRQAFARYLHNDGPAYVEGSIFHLKKPLSLLQALVEFLFLHTRGAVRACSGAIPFPRVHVDRFLAHALDELLIWKEQEPLVRRTLAELGMGVEIVKIEGSDAERSPDNSKANITRATTVPFGLPL